MKYRDILEIVLGGLECVIFPMILILAQWPTSLLSQKGLSGLSPLYNTIFYYNLQTNE